MKTLYWPLICQAVVLITIAPPANAILQTSDCWGAGSTFEQNKCFEGELGKANQALTNTFDKLVQLAKNHGDEWVKDLRKAQSRWTEFRQGNCAFFGGYLEGGSGAVLYYMDCMVRITNERNAELKKATSILIERGYE